MRKPFGKNQDISGEKAAADQLLKDVKERDGAIESLKVTLEKIAAGEMELLNEAGISKITGEERYSRINVVDLMSNMEGSEAVYQTVKSALVKDRSDMTENQERF